MRALAPTVKTEWSRRSICSELCSPLETRSPRCTSSRTTAGRRAASASVFISTLLRTAALTPTLAAPAAGKEASAAVSAKSETESVVFIGLLRSTVAETPHQIDIHADAAVIGQRLRPDAGRIGQRGLEDDVLHVLDVRAQWLERGERHAERRARIVADVLARLGELRDEDDVDRAIVHPAHVALHVEIDARSQRADIIRARERRVVGEAAIARGLELVAAEKPDRGMGIDPVRGAQLRVVAAAVARLDRAGGQGDERRVVVLPHRFRRRAE